MADQPRYVPRFAAEPPQEELPYGRWADRLAAVFLEAALEMDDDEELGAVGEIAWYPDRSWHGFTYVPATCRTEGDYEVFGYVRYRPAGDDREPTDFVAQVDYTDEVAERNPDWTMDLCEEVVGSWRGVGGRAAAMTLVWGRPLLSGGEFVAGELGGLMVDASPLVGERFTLVAPDDFAGDLLDVVLYDGKGKELARESLYDGDDADDATNGDDAAGG